MSRELELIKEIDEHIEKACGLYGMELSNSDLRIIQAALHKAVEVEPADIETGGFRDKALCCPAYGNPITNYWKIGTVPLYCQFCGQAIREKEGNLS